MNSSHQKPYPNYSGSPLIFHIKKPEKRKKNKNERERNEYILTMWTIEGMLFLCLVKWLREVSGVVCYFVSSSSSILRCGIQLPINIWGYLSFFQACCCNCNRCVLRLFSSTCIKTNNYFLKKHIKLINCTRYIIIPKKFKFRGRKK